MSIHDKIKKLKKTKKCDIFKIAGNERTGVVNSLVMLGSVAAFISAIEHEVNAITCNAVGEIEDTDLSAIGPQIDDSQWKNHCWNWSWCWCWTWSWSWSWSHDAAAI